MATNLGLSEASFKATYPEAANHLGVNARWVAAYLATIGTMGFLAALTGRLRGERWAWYITWVFVAATVAIVAVGLSEGFGAFGATMLTLAVTALTGQMLARRGLT